MYIYHWNLSLISFERIVSCSCYVAESLRGNVLGERKGIGLTFAANVHFCIQNYFFIKKIEAKMRVFCCCNCPVK